MVIQLNQEIEQKLNQISSITHKPKDYFVIEALKNYLEDITDVIEAKQRLNDNNRETISLDELKRELNV